MTAIVPIWQNKNSKQFYAQCWNCGWLSKKTKDVGTAMKSARNHFKTCGNAGRWTTDEGRQTVMVGCEFTFG